MEGMREEGIKFIRHTVGDSLSDGLNNEFKERGISALHERLDKYFDMANIRPDFVEEASDSDNFEKLRERLNTEPGFVIANHPGYIDVASIFRSLNRDDFKVMVSSGRAEHYRKILGDEHVVPATKDPKEVISIVREIKTHIENGGLFVIFPSGRRDVDQIKFKKGFPLLVNQVDPDAMVYNFYFDEDDARKIQEVLPTRNMGVASELFLTPGLDLNGLGETLSFKIREAYTKAGEWQDALSGADKKDRGEVATKHYKNIFGIE